MGAHRPRSARGMGLVLAAAMALVGGTASAARGTGPFDALPNLVPIPPTDVHVGSTDDGSGTAIRLTVSTANRGPQALDLLGVPEQPNALSRAFQCVAWATHRACLERSEVGKFVYHSAHSHWHFEDYALYELRSYLEDGSVDMSPEGLVATGGKASFCLIDYDPDGPPSHPAYEDAYLLYSTCAFSLTGVGFQGISPGWKDTYVSGLDGQQIPIDGVPDGFYAVVLTADPDDRLFETSNADNVAVTHVELVDGGTTLRLV